ncbi:MAG: hypothetical protein KBS58_05285, partial [Bacteroidales bacterium]|nr:hypothetical protein [Candidatus Cacconaster equi]
AQDKAKSWQERVYLEYYVEDKGDTVYVDELRPSVVFPRIKRNTPDLRKYARLVYNFNRVIHTLPLPARSLTRLMPTSQG